MADVVDENIDVVDDQSEVDDDQKDDEEPPESPRRGKWWGFSCRGELPGDDRADALADVGEAQSGKFTTTWATSAARRLGLAPARRRASAPLVAGPSSPRARRSAAVDADLATGGPGRSRR